MSALFSHLSRFGANSPGDRPGKFARSGLAQPELHQQLVSSQRAGEHAGEQRSSFAAKPFGKYICTRFVSNAFFHPKKADEQNLSLSEKARLHLEKYSFPVEMMVALPNGTVVS